MHHTVSGQYHTIPNEVVSQSLEERIKNKLTPIPLMNRHTRFNASPIGPETYFVISAEIRIGKGRNAPK
jgi:hypothetical protein